MLITEVLCCWHLCVYLIWFIWFQKTTHIFLNSYAAEIFENLWIHLEKITEKGENDARVFQRGLPNLLALVNKSVLDWWMDWLSGSISDWLMDGSIEWINQGLTDGLIDWVDLKKDQPFFFVFAMALWTAKVFLNKLQLQQQDKWT